MAGLMQTLTTRPAATPAAVDLSALATATSVADLETRFRYLLVDHANQFGPPRGLETEFAIAQNQ